MDLDEVSRKTGVPIEKLRQQQAAMRALRAKQPVSVSPPAPPAPKHIPYSPQSGPLRLQKQMHDAGVL